MSMAKSLRWTLPALAVFACLAWAGCSYSTRSGLPQHITTVKIPVVKNNTMYVGTESKLTRALVERAAKDAQVRVVQINEDAELRCQIIDIKKSVIRETTSDKPASVRIVITAKVFFEDKVTGEMLLDGSTIRSQRSSSKAGVYDIERGETAAEGEDSAVSELADEIIRASIGMWKSKGQQQDEMKKFQEKEKLKEAEKRKKAAEEQEQKDTEKTEKEPANG